MSSPSFNPLQSVQQLLQSLGEPKWWGHRTQGFKGSQHPGNDFGIPLRSPIASVSSGRVVYSQRMNSDPTSAVGWIVQVENSDGSLFHYHHLYSSAVHVGDYVQAGQVLGLSGGCPQGAYGTKGCTRFDKYSNGPHIEVRYSPNYDPSRSHWQQNWSDPMPAILAYAGSGAGIGSIFPNLLGAQADLVGSLNRAGPTINFPDRIGVTLGGNFAEQMASGIGAGISRGINQVIGDQMHPAADLSIRVLLVVGGGVAVFVAVMALLTVKTREKFQEVAGPAIKQGIQAEVGSQVGQAVVPPVGTRKRIRELGGNRPQVAAAPNLPQLPAPSQEDLNKAFVDNQNAEFLARAEKREREYKESKRRFDAARAAVGHDAPAASVDAKVIEPVDLPIPKAAEAGASGRQRQNKLNEIGRRLKRADEAKARRKARRKGKP